MKKRIKKGLLIVSLALFAGSTVATATCNFDVTPISTKAEEPLKTDFGPYSDEWFRIYADGYPAYDADENVGNPDFPNGKANIDIYLSPEFKDYKTFNKESIKKFLDADEGLIGAIKYILGQQVKFIQPVEKGEDRTENADLEKMWNEQDGHEKTDIYSSSNGSSVTIFSQFVDAVIEATSDNFDEKYQDYLYAMEDSGSLYRGVLDEIQNGESLSYTVNDIMLFLRQILAYAAGTSIDGDEDIATRLGVTSSTTADINSGLGVALKAIYDTAEIDSIDSAVLIENDILKIYEDACDIAGNVGKQSLALIEAFVLLENTEIPMSIMTDIVGGETIKEAVIEIFTDPNECISTETAKFLLEHFDNDTIYDLCEEIKFTKDEIKEAIGDIEPARLMEIARDLSPHAMDVIRIILGMANDNDEKSHKRSQEHYQYKGQYNKFGNELVNTVLSNMELMDLINAVEAVWVGDPTDANYVADEALVYSYNYTPENETTREGRRLYLKNFINWINRDFDEIINKIATRDPIDQKETIHFEVKTPLNEQNIFCDLTIGFMPEKDFTDLKRHCKTLDDAFDLEFTFIEGMVDETPDYSLNTLDFDLAVHPQYATNLFELFFGEDVLLNDSGLRLKEHLFDLLFNKTFGELKEYFTHDLDDEIINDLKHINYETLINTFLDFNKLKEVFKGVQSAESTFTNADIIEFVSNLKWWMNKHKNYTFDYLKESLSSILGDTLANKINSEVFKNFVNDIASWCSETSASNIDISVLKVLTNTEIYGFVDLLIENNKQDVLNRVANLICRIINILPDSEDEINSTVKLDDCTIMDFYTSNGQFNFEKEPYLLDWEEILFSLPLGDKLYILLNGMIAEADELVLADTHVTIDANASLKEGSASVHSVTYEYYENGKLVTLKGLLPEGATVLDFAKNVIDGNEVDHWEIKSGEHQGESLLVMPNYDVVLTPIFKDRTGSMPVFIIVLFGLLNIAALVTWYIVTLNKEDEDDTIVVKKETKVVIVEKKPEVKSEVKVEKKKVVKPVEKKAEPKPEAKPVEKKVKPKPAVKPVEKKAEPKPEAKPVEKKETVKKEAKKVTAKPTEKKATVKPSVKKSEPKPEAKPVEKKVEPKPAVKKTTAKSTAKKATKPTVKKSTAKPASKPVESKPEVKKVEKKAEPKPVAKKTAKPVEKKPASKPVAVVKPVEPKPAAKPVESKPEVKKVEKKAEPKPTVKKTTAKPATKKVTAKPAVKKATTKPVVKKAATTPVVKKTETKPAVKTVEKKVETKPVVKPQTVIASRKRGKGRGADKPARPVFNIRTKIK